MRCSNVTASALLFGVALLAGCAGTSTSTPRAQIVSARIENAPAPQLVADLKLAFSPEMLEALDRGIALTLELDVRAEDRSLAGVTRSLTLRYLPLAQRYQLRDDSGAERSFARRSQLLAALDRVRITLPDEWARPPARARLDLALDRSALPGPLRLPALYRRAWRFRADGYAWTPRP